MFLTVEIGKGDKNITDLQCIFVLKHLVIDGIFLNRQNCAKRCLYCIWAIFNVISQDLKKAKIGLTYRRSGVQVTYRPLIFNTLRAHLFFAEALVPYCIQNLKFVSRLYGIPIRVLSKNRK